ncbi:MAG: geranylgeranylglycerol-phosphate geranylgeranyltransferase [Thermoproteota archaeon]|nr:geranylgeranylglycerol-phosphate geranylgeranyltransferase [Thermoproteota archaeon]
MIMQFLYSSMILVRSRLRLLILYPLPLLIGMIVALRSLPNTILMIESIISISATSFAVYIYNDLQDIKEDTENAKLGTKYHIDRPLLNGVVTRRHAKGFILCTIMISLCSSVLVARDFFILISVCLILGFTYSSSLFHLKSKFPFKQLTIATGVALAILAGGSAVGVISKPLLYILTLFFVMYFCVNPIMDIRDLYGDFIVGRKTLPMILNPKKTITIGIVSMMSLAIISMISYDWVGFNFLFPILSGSTLLVMTFSIFKVLQNYEQPNYIDRIFARKIFVVLCFLHASFVIGILPF